MRRPLVIYDFATAPFWISLNMRKISVGSLVENDYLLLVCPDCPKKSIFCCSVSGLSPFMGDTDLETMANVTIAEYDYEDEAFEKVSDLARDFIDKLLVKQKE